MIIKAFNFSRIENKFYFIGLPKTGSSSFAGVLEKFNAHHEFYFKETITKLYELRNEVITQENFNSFLVKREKSMTSKFDSSTFNFHYVYDLKENKFNRFVFPIRDMYSWSNSLLNHIYFHFTEYGIQDWHNTLCKLFFGDNYTAQDFISIDSIKKNMDDLIPKLALYWYNGMKNVLDNLPESTLILNTRKKEQNLELIADFTRTKIRDLNLEGWDMNKARYNVDYLSFNKSRFEISYNEYFPEILVKLNSLGIYDILEFNSFEFKK